MAKFVVPLFLLLPGCAGSFGNMEAVDPSERGLSYLAAAIVTHAIISAIFRN